MAENLAGQLAVDQVDTDYFVSRALPQPTGNAMPIAYGGCTIGVAVHAACKTVSPKFHVFSVLGSFLGPTAIDRQVHCRVTRLRETKTFATRHVVAFQVQDNSTERYCMQISVDFQIKEPALLTYSTPPQPSLGSDPHDEKYALPVPLVLQRSVENRLITSQTADTYLKSSSMTYKYFDINLTIEGVSVQNALGLAKHAMTNQDDRATYDKTAAEWMRAKQPLDSYMENAAALGFMMDGGLSFLPLYFNHMNMADASACSTLDFALRIMTPDIDIATWKLRERKTIAAAGGRTYSESKLWTQEGQMVAIMSQTSILRPLKPKQQENASRL